MKLTNTLDSLRFYTARMEMICIEKEHRFYFDKASISFTNVYLFATN